MKQSGFLLLVVVFGISNLGVVASQEVTQKQKPTSKIGQFSLRNDAENLTKPIGSPVALEPKERVEEVKKVEEKAISGEELRPKIPQPTVKPKEVKREEVVKEEERMGLKFAEGKEELPKIIAKTKVPPPPPTEPTLPEESKYFLQLTPQEPLPKVKPEIKKPKVIAKPPVEEEKVVVAKTEEIIPPAQIEEKLPVPKPKFAFERINPVIKWLIVLFGLLTLILFLWVRYLWRQRELVALSEIEGIPAEKPGVYKSLVEDVKELQAGYRGLEKMVENVDKKLGVLKGVPIEEFTRQTSKETLKPIETGIKELQTTCQGLEKMFGDFDKRLAPLDALKGLSIKELAQQTSMEVYRPIENEFKKMQVSYERIMTEVEENIDKKFDAINKKSKNLEKSVAEIDSRLITVDSIVSSLPRTELSVAKPMIKTEEVKSTTTKDKRTREILHNQIYKLSDEGLSIDEIAQRTKLGKGEVRLILGLRKK
ncbi:MAG: hypothetical protein AB1422_14390 [bacterium]